MELHASGEDYLEAVLMLQKKLGMVRSVDLARHMGYSKTTAAAELAKKRAYAFEAAKKSRRKMYEEAATGNPEVVERYEHYLAARREAYHRKKQEA